MHALSRYALTFIIMSVGAFSFAHQHNEAGEYYTAAVQPDRDFTLLFAWQNTRSFYRLSHTAEKQELHLIRVVNDAQQQIAATFTPAHFSRIGVALFKHVIRIELDNRILLEADDSTFRAGTAFFEGSRNTIPSAPTAAEFSESFDNHEAVFKQWETLAGEWLIRAPRDAHAKANNLPPRYSVYKTHGAGLHITATGGPAWTNIEMNASVRLGEADEAGIVFHITDADNYSTLLVGRDQARIVDVVNGQPMTVAFCEEIDLHEGQWTSLRVQTSGRRVWAEVDGCAVFAAFRRPGITSGRIGLVASGNDARFDAITVRPFTSFIELFSQQHINRWDMTDNLMINDNVLTGTGKALFTYEIDGITRIDADVMVSPHSQAAIITRATDASNYYAFGLLNREWQLQRVIKGIPNVIARAPANNLHDDAYLTLVDNRGWFDCYADGKLVLSASDAALPKGLSGILLTNATATAFRLAEHRERPGAVILNTILPTIRNAYTRQPCFFMDGFMRPLKQGWQMIFDGTAYRLVCNDSDTLVMNHLLPGDIVVSARADLLGSPSITIASDSDGRGYTFGVSSKHHKFVLFRRNILLSERAITDQKGSVLLTLRRRGRTIQALVDDQPIMTYTDPFPLLGGRVAFAGGKGALFRKIMIKSENGSVHNFNRMPTEWREAGGTWSIRRGMNDNERAGWIEGSSENELAMLLNRTSCTGNFILYATIAPAHRGNSDGTTRRFPLQDVGIAFRADPDTPGRGYTVMLRPEGKPVVRLLRHGRQVAEAPLPIPIDKPVRAGLTMVDRRIELRLNNEPVLVYDDVVPILTGHFGLVVKNNRARFADILILPEN